MVEIPTPYRREIRRVVKRGPKRGLRIGMPQRQPEPSEFPQRVVIPSFPSIPGRKAI